MSYVRGNLAEQIGYGQSFDQSEAAQWRASQQPQFGVIDGSASQEAPSKILSPTAQTALSAARVIGIALVVFCIAAVAIMGVTRIVMEQDRTITSEITDAQAQGRQLEVQVAVNEDSSRIIRLATQAYGMVPADQTTLIEVSGDTGSTTSAQAEASTQASQPTE